MSFSSSRQEYWSQQKVAIVYNDVEQMINNIIIAQETVKKILRLDFELEVSLYQNEDTFYYYVEKFSARIIQTVG